MNDTMNATPPSNDSAYKSLLYWRKNLWLGSSCVPIILTLESKTLSLKQSDDTIVFREPIDAVTVRFSGWGTMTLVVRGKKYDLVGMPAASSPQISSAQQAELSGLSVDGSPTHVQDMQPVTLGSTVASTTGSTGSTIVGAAVSTAAYYRGLTSIREWKALIGSAADQKRQFGYMTYFIIVVVVVLVIAIMLK
jgi:hypothetical protein